ncbi:hypothetical protein [Micromonospora sp. b486]|uniref:hypothetical protein n=1 Tax=Micromonospora sp. b486 TaxID=3053986 RepID=UPI00259CA7F4|nr:hypothetical protein [Micromonospora sp. b486]MDM4778013.1 hypothetical protein [Micromonospora sp. b486]
MTDAGDIVGQCASRNLLARAILDQGDVASALDLHRRVLTDATRLGARYEQARALDGMARCLRHTPIPARPAVRRAGAGAVPPGRVAGPVGDREVADRAGLRAAPLSLHTDRRAAGWNA